MITPTDQQITAAFDTSNTAYSSIEEKSLNDDGKKFADSLRDNEKFRKNLKNSALMITMAGAVGLEGSLMRAFLAGFEAGKVITQNESANLGTGTGALQGAGSSRIPVGGGKPRC